ncbi:DUF4145 domain-containing protein [Flavobacterium sp. CF136]|uniref:DUF4145 domain-containing protein n=1 Tax=Flavobacterium sp. (strain CF136) TaxID=1144313 RepID=UPI0002719F4A|nr:DUF4145 domain-containing protein [Flavobacterium sp. CF136]EJL64756.1 hypothetical protein PMI10_01733 [Flavobacterium sp. CF136]
MIKYIVDKTKDKNLKVICQTCKNTTKHKVLNSANEEGEAFMPEEGYNYYWQNDYEIIQCLGCETISFRSEHSNSEDMDYEEGPYIVEHIFPQRNKDTWHIKNYYNVPHNLRRIYRETIDCYNAECLTLCGAGTRALVEGICKESGILDGEVKKTKPDGTIEIKRSKDLQGKINGLFEKGKLTEQNAEILHEHRFLGNTSIHELSAPSKDELSLAIEIIENVFDTLYEIPQKALELKHKRMLKKK